MNWDVFICHASEDKTSVARPLHDLLVSEGLKVWLDENEMKVGASLRESIDKGLAQSRFGVVILSRAFFGKEWTERELSGLMARETERSKVILPVWHGVDRDFVVQFSPVLADRVAVSTSRGLERAAREIADVCRSSVVESPARSGEGTPHEKMERSQPNAASRRRTPDEANVMKNRAIVHRRRGELRTAEELLDEVLQIYRELDNPAGQANALNNLGIVYRLQGRMAAGQVAHEEALRFYELAGDRRGQADSLRNRAIIHRAVSELDISKALLFTAVAIYKECGDRSGEAKTLNELGMTSREAGELESAQNYYSESEQIYTEIAASPSGEKPAQAVNARIELGPASMEQDSHQLESHAADERGGEDSGLEDLRRLMPELLAEMQRDLAGDETRLITEFVILPSESVIFNGSKRRFTYHENRHENLQNKIDALEERGLVRDVTTGNTPIYRLTEQFREALRRP